MLPLQFLLLALAAAAAKNSPFAHHANPGANDLTAHAVTKTVYHTSLLRVYAKAHHTTTQHGGPAPSRSLSTPQPKRCLAARHEPHTGPAPPGATKSAELAALHILFGTEDGHMMLYLPGPAAATFRKDVAGQSAKRGEATVVELVVQIGKEVVKIPVPQDNAVAFCQALGTAGEEAESKPSATLPEAGKTSEAAKPPKSGAAKRTAAVSEDVSPTPSKATGDLASKAAPDTTTPSAPAEKTPAPAVKTPPLAPSPASPPAEDPYALPISAESPEATAKQATTPAVAPESAEALASSDAAPPKITHATPLTTLLVAPVDDGAVVHADNIAAPTPTPAAPDQPGRKTTHVTSYLTMHKRAESTMGAAVRPRAEDNAAAKRAEFGWWWRRRSTTKAKGSSAKAPKPTDPPEAFEEGAEESGKGESEGEVVVPSSLMSTKKASKPSVAPVPWKEAMLDQEDDAQQAEDSPAAEHDLTAPPSTKNLPKPTKKPKPSQAAADDGKGPAEEEGKSESKEIGNSLPLITAKPSKPAPSKTPSSPEESDSEREGNVPEDTADAITTPSPKSSKPKPSPPPAENEDPPSRTKSPKHIPTTSSSDETDAGATQYAHLETISHSFPSATDAAKQLPPPPAAQSHAFLLSWDPSGTPTTSFPALHTAPNAKADLGCWVSVPSDSNSDERDDKDSKAEKTNTSNELTESSAAWGKIHDPRLRWTVVLMWGLLVLQVLLGWWEFGKGAWGWQRWVPVVGQVRWWDGKIAAVG